MLSSIHTKLDSFSTKFGCIIVDIIENTLTSPCFSKTEAGQIESLEICIWAWIQRAYLTCTPHLTCSKIKGLLSLCVIMYLSPIVSGYCLALTCVINRNNSKFYTGQVFNITKGANESIYRKETKWESEFLITLVTAIHPLCQTLPCAKHKT